MKADLVALTQPRIKTEDDSRFLTAEEFIIYTARVSNPSNQLNLDTAPKLLNWLLKQEPPHISPFEQVYVTFEIETSRAIAAQLLRHWSIRFQEFSQRYAVVEGLKFEPVELRLRGATNRQSSLEVAPGVLANLDQAVQELLTHAENVYEVLIQNNVAPEVARMVLPLTTTTRMYVTGSIRSFIYYFEQRCSSHAQKEHRELASTMRELLSLDFPVLAQTLSWNA